jgi:hypothetical protein
MMTTCVRKFLLPFSAVLLASMALAQSTPIPASSFGMHEHRLLPTVGTNEPWPVNSSGGQTIGSIRTWDMQGITGWFELEPSNCGTTSSCYLWTYLDDLVADAQANNADVLYTFGWTPQWAIGSAPCINSAAGFTGSPSPGCAMAPSSMTYWTDFVDTLVQRYAGKIKYYELWNEPNTASSTGVGSFWNGPSCTSSSCPSVTAQEDFTDMLTMASILQTAIQTYSPSSNLVSPAPNFGQCQSAGVGGNTYPSCWLNDFFDAGAGQYVNIVAFHGYLPSGGTPTGTLPTIVGDIKSVMSSQGQSSKPLWNTESSLCNGASPPDLTAQFELMSSSLGVARHYWYAWDNPNCGGLWSPTSGLNSGGMSYAQMYQWLVGSQYTQGGCQNTSGTATWYCNMIEANGTTAVALWQTTSGTATYTVGADLWVDFRDVCGNRVILGATVPTCNGVTETSSPTSVTIATQPILLEAAAPEAPPPIISVPPTITTTTLPNGIQNTAYSSTVTASGGATSYTWSVSTGSLPTGLTLTSGTPSATISGTPSAIGTYTFTLQVVDNVGDTNTKTYTVTISPTPTPTPTPPSTPSPNGSAIPPLTQLMDSALNVWTVSSGIIYENGGLAGYSANVTLLLYYNGYIYQQNNAGGWWEWSAGTWAVASGDPRLPPPTPTPTPTPIGSCPAPTNTITADAGTYQAGNWQAQQDEWNASGVAHTQTMSYNTATFPNCLSASWTYPAGYNEVYTYPHIQWLLPAATTPISSLSAFTANYGVTIGGQTALFDVAWDIWLQNSSISKNGTVEIMITLHEPMNPMGSNQPYSLTTSSFSNANVYVSNGWSATSSNPGWLYVNINPTSDILSGTMDILGVFNALIAHGVLTGQETISSGNVQLGAEALGGSGTYTLNQISYNWQLLGGSF